MIESGERFPAFFDRDCKLIISIWLTIRSRYDKIMDMSVKQDVLKVLEKRRGESVSGEDLADELGVSRAAVWKAVKGLKAEGHAIHAATNRGYLLEEDSDVLTAPSVQRFLTHDFDVIVEKKVTSTNDAAKKLALGGAKEWTVILSEEQSAGRGRFARSFYSPRGAGIYCSVVLRPTYTAAETLFITTCAAVAVAEGIERVTGRSADIKWVNDVFVSGKKVCGILTEASFSVENGGLEYAVLGFGINVKTQAFPAELANVAAALYPDGECSGDTRAKLVACILERFRYYYENIPVRAFYPEYKRRSILIGKTVLVTGGESGEAEVLDIDENCYLRVRFADGRECPLSSGEVSVKIQ